MRKTECDRIPNFDYVVSKIPRPCWQCGKWTDKVEINFEASLCSVECYTIKEAEYFDSLGTDVED